MPTVRKYGQLTRYQEPRVEARPIPDAGFTPAFTGESLGAGVELAKAKQWQAAADAAQQVGQVAAGFAELDIREIAEETRKAKEFADTMAVLDGNNQINNWKRDYVYDPETGVLATRGKDSFATPEQTDAEFEKIASEVQGRMVTPEQQIGMKRAIIQHREEIGLTTRRHVEQESKRYAATELTKSMENSVDLGVTAATTKDSDGNYDLGRAELYLADAEKNLLKVGPTIGMTPAQIADQARELRTQMHGGIIKQLLADNASTAAKAYYEEVKGELDSEQRTELKKAVDVGTVRKEAQIETERILGEHGTLEEQRRAAKEIDDPEVQDEVLRRLEHEDTVNERIANDKQRALRKSISDKLDAVPNVTLIAPGDWSQLDEQSKSSLRSYANQIVADGEVRMDRSAWYRHVLNSGKDPIGWANRTNLLHDKDKIPRSQWNQLADLQGDILRGTATKSDTLLASVQTNQSAVNGVLEAAGYNLQPKVGSDQAKALDTFRSEVDRLVVEQQEATGKKMSPPEIRALANDLMIELTLKEGSWFNVLPGSGPFRDVVKRAAELTITDMSETDKANAKQYLESKGTPATEQAIVDVWRRLKIAEARRSGK